MLTASSTDHSMHFTIHKPISVNTENYKTQKLCAIFNISYNNIIQMGEDMKYHNFIELFIIYTDLLLLFILSMFLVYRLLYIHLAASTPMNSMNKIGIYCTDDNKDVES